MESFEKTAIEQARYIFTTGKLIHDRILKIQGRYLASCAAGSMGDISVTQLHAVRIVRARGEASMSELAEALGVSAPSVSTMVDRLVEKGVLCREHAVKDRRKVVARISPGAIKRVEAFEASIMQLFVRLVQKIGLENAQKWCEVLATVKVVLNEEFDPLSPERSD